MIGQLKIASKPGLTPVGLSWALDPTCGWGNYATQICLHLKKHSYIPIPLGGAVSDRLTTLQSTLLSSNLQISQQLQSLAQQRNFSEIHFECPVIHAMDANFAFSARYRGGSNIGLVFFEGSKITEAAIANANRFDVVCAGSSWNAQILKEHGVENVVTVLQGIDPTVFHPAQRSGLLNDRFVVFSGGKLEFRKGQDIVVAAFRAFCRNYPDALLVTSWHNHWPRLMQTIGQAGHVNGPPAVADRSLKVTEWLIDNGIPAKNVLDMGLVPNHMMASIIREADVAVFPNRAEGGTNLVAMESMACGVPCVLSANTGHLDLIDDDRCLVLHKQDSIDESPGFNGTQGWGESDPVELLDALEKAYASRAELQKLGENAATFMRDWHWDKKIGQLAREIEKSVNLQSLNSSP